MSDIKYYILDSNNNPVLCPNIGKWTHWMLNGPTPDIGRRVASTKVGEAIVSTIFTGQTMCGGLHDARMIYLFETMVLAPESTITQLKGGELDGNVGVIETLIREFNIQRRYTTWAEAEAGHAEMVKLLERALSSRN